MAEHKSEFTKEVFFLSFTCFISSNWFSRPAGVIMKFKRLTLTWECRYGRIRIRIYRVSPPPPLFVSFSFVFKQVVLEPRGRDHKVKEIHFYLESGKGRRVTNITTDSLRIGQLYVVVFWRYVRATGCNHKVQEGHLDLKSQIKDGSGTQLGTTLEAE